MKGSSILDETYGLNKNNITNPYVLLGQSAGQSAQNNSLYNTPKARVFMVGQGYESHLESYHGQLEGLKSLLTQNGSSTNN